MANTELLLYDEIGSFGISSRDFIDQMKPATTAFSPIDLRINSGGGSVFDGYAIYNALKRHTPGVNVYIDGLAASIASYIAMAGSKISMAKNAMIMIHRPANSVGGGNADEMRKNADILDQVEASIVDAYSARTGIPAAEISKMLDEETWMDSAQALAFGFIDEVTPELAMAAHIDTAKLKNFKNVPLSLMQISTQEQQTTEDGRQTTDDTALPNPPSVISPPSSETAAPSIFARVSGWLKDNAGLVNENASLRTEIEAKTTESAGYVNQITEQQAVIARLEGEVTQFKTDAKALEEAVAKHEAEKKSVSENTAAQIAALGFDQTKLPAAVPSDAVKNEADILAEYNDIPADSENAAAKTEFYRKNKDALRRARAVNK